MICPHPSRWRYAQCTVVSQCAPTLTHQLEAISDDGAGPQGKLRFRTARDFANSSRSFRLGKDICRKQPVDDHARVDMIAGFECDCCYVRCTQGFKHEDSGRKISPACSSRKRTGANIPPLHFFHSSQVLHSIHSTYSSETFWWDGWSTIDSRVLKAIWGVQSR